MSHPTLGITFEASSYHLRQDLVSSLTAGMFDVSAGDRFSSFVRIGYLDDGHAAFPCGEAFACTLRHGSPGTPVKVFTGSIATIAPGLTTTRITAHGTADKLLHTFLNHTYECMSAGDIARDLAQKAGLEVASAEEGITFPAYVIDDRRSAFHHLHDIAALCGFDCYCNALGQLVFQAFKGGNTVHVLEYGTHILQLDILQSSPSASRFEAWGESPGGSRGDKAWSWLTKDFTPSRGVAGDGTPRRLLERSVLRTADAARLAAQAAQAASVRRSLRGRVLLPGRPEIQLGDAIRLAQLPNSALNATFQVRGITHRLSRRHGFTTAVDFQRIP